MWFLSKNSYMNAALQLLAANVDVCRLLTSEKPVAIVDEDGTSIVAAQTLKRW
jgi:hypothetical protein